MGLCLLSKRQQRRAWSVLVDCSMPVPLPPERRGRQELPDELGNCNSSSDCDGRRDRQICHNKLTVLCYACTGMLTRGESGPPIWTSISMIFSMLAGTISVDVTRFSTARMTPSGVWIPIAVDPSCKSDVNIKHKCMPAIASTTSKTIDLHLQLLIITYLLCWWRNLETHLYIVIYNNIFIYCYRYPGMKASSDAFMPGYLSSLTSSVKSFYQQLLSLLPSLAAVFRIECFQTVTQKKNFSSVCDHVLKTFTREMLHQRDDSAAKWFIWDTWRIKAVWQNHQPTILFQVAAQSWSYPNF